MILAIQRVRNQCNLLLGESLFVVNFQKTVRFDEFETLQGAVLQQMLGFIRDNWVPALKSDIRNSLKDVGKGSFNLQETNREIYEFSKLKRFLTMVNLKMEDSLRYMEEQSVTQYQKFLMESTVAKVTLALSRKPIP